MTILMLAAKRLSFVLFLSCLFAVVLAPRAEAQQLSIQAVDVVIGPAPDGTAQATFSIKVTNNEQSALENFVVAFKDGTTTALGDVPAKNSVVSLPETKAIDNSTRSASIPIPVTLTYFLGGNAVEIPWSVVLTRP